jgi:hypothetical protein
MPAHGRPSWAQVVESVARVWRERRDDVEAQSDRVLAALSARPEASRAVQVGSDTLRELGANLLARADLAHGGFGGAPKFPTPTNLEAILAAAARRAAPTGALEHVVFTLERMARGGIYDQLGGGFHRYSTDARWLVPHFEKMLYDQGQLLRVYAEAYRQTREAKLAWPVAETVDFLERELRDPAGFFFASLDADSEGEEGRFYVWTPAEVEAVLGPEAGPEFCAAYGVEPGGNFERTGASVLAHGLAGERPRFAESRARLLAARAARARPATDPKAIAAWNAFAIGGLATAGAAFDRPDWVASAARAADFVLTRMRDAEGRLLRIFDGERARVPGFLDDHAALLSALLDLARAGGPERCIPAALALADALRARFWDADARAFRFAPLDGERLFFRAGSDSDGATPAAGGLAALGLVRLAGLSGRADLRDLAERAIAAEAPLAARVPLAYPTLLRAAALLECGLGVALVMGPPEDSATRALARRARELLSCDDSVVVLAAGERPPWLAAEWLEGRAPAADRPTAWICRGRVCSLPATEPEGLALP